MPSDRRIGIAVAAALVLLWLVWNRDDVARWFSSPPAQSAAKPPASPPTPPAPPPPRPSAPPAQSPRERAALLRTEAFRACDRQVWRACLIALDAAKELDPEGDADGRVQDAWSRARAALDAGAN